LFVFQKLDPMLLQDTICATTSSVLTISFVQIILIGDHHQLPPVVKNQAFQKYSHLDQTLFTRFIRLGVPYHELTAQGRCRPSIAKLYNWRYRALGDLPHVRTLPRFRTPNAGFAYDFQFVGVRPCRGPGESTPSPHFYQNVDEAEFVVRVYMYMRLIGYPAERITLLTTYNGQKALLEDIVRRHCTSNALFGAPAKIATVDKYQGQQNDYVLLSLVRTRSVGHLRDGKHTCEGSPWRGAGWTAPQTQEEAGVGCDEGQSWCETCHQE
jgi:intron-binding protein aquarius